MCVDPFQFISLSNIRKLDSPIIYVITAEKVQQFLEDNYGEQLSDEQLQDFTWAFMETWDCEFLDDAISKVRPRVRLANND